MPIWNAKHRQNDKDETGKVVGASDTDPVISEDGKRIFYTDGKTLMYRNLEKGNESDMVIDTNVIEYATDAKGSQIKELGLEVGKEAYAVIKATSVMVGVDD